MELIKRIQVEGFRSLATEAIEPVGNFTCFVGANNSGKSNILRALSLFFTGQPEPGVSLDFTRDYHADPKRKKKKRIIVAVSFSLPDYFHFSKKLKGVEERLGREFTIRRRWTLDQIEPVTELLGTDGEFHHLDPLTVKQFTNLINFRYIQNRIIPAQALRDESRAFRDHVGRRLRQKGKGTDADALLKTMRETAADVVSEVDKMLKASTASMKNLEMSTPLDVAELPEISGFRARIATGAQVTDDAWGAGTQAYAMFGLLKVIDTDFGTQFGWRQATVWAIEEPESSLHKDLEQRLAITLSEWSGDNKQRMQLLCTTHSEVFVTTASEGFMVELKEGCTAVAHKEIPDLVYRSATMGISGPVEPVLCFPTNPVVLVEGSLDRRILTHVSQRREVATNCKFLPVPELDPVETGRGAEGMVRYLKQYGKLAQKRAVNAPLIVLFDWDVDDQTLQKAREHYGANADLRVLRMDTSHADSRISSQIRGIERFYPAELFHAAREANIVDVAIDQDGNISIEKKKLDSAKSTLADMLCSAPNDDWYRHLYKVLVDVEHAGSLLPGEQLPFEL